MARTEARASARKVCTTSPFLHRSARGCICSRKLASLKHRMAILAKEL